MSLHREGRLIEAEAAYLAIPGEWPDEREPLQLVGLVYQQSGQTARAIQFLRRANELMRNSHAILHNLAVSLGEAGQLEAAEQFERAVALDPDVPGAHSSRLFLLNHLSGHDPQAASRSSVAGPHASWRRRRRGRRTSTTTAIRSDAFASDACRQTCRALRRLLHRAAHRSSRP